MSKDKTYTILKSDRRWHITLPAVLAQAVGLNAGDTVKWVVDRVGLVFRKV